jgi:hypothetical protein
MVYQIVSFKFKSIPSASSVLASTSTTGTAGTATAHHVASPKNILSVLCLLGLDFNLHIRKVGIAHQARHVRHATTLTEAFGHLAHARVAH